MAQRTALFLVARQLVTCACLLTLWWLSISVAKEPPACLIRKRRQQCIGEDRAQEDVVAAGADLDRYDERRVIVIGDVHGSYDGLRDNLYSANITANENSCVWKHQPGKGTVLIQMGDIVDRGPQALESWKCLRSLQADAAKFNSKVVRLFGNHEMWWLTGIYYKRHPRADTKKRIVSMIEMITEDVAKGDVLGAYVHTLHEVPVLFTHAGVSKKFFNYLERQIVRSNGESLTPKHIASYTNKKLIEVIGSCSSFPCQMNQDRYELFDAGPDRGGKGIGGPFWTDFSTVVANRDALDFVQVVGHTMAYCYNPRQPDVHPPRTQAECGLGLTRASTDLRSICVDGGMYLGARTFLEISAADAHFISYQRYWNSINDPSWYRRDLSSEVCS